jgi:hypothetical protein
MTPSNATAIDGRGMKRENRRAFQMYGWAGLAVILLMELTLLLKEMAIPGTWTSYIASRLAQWTTPVCWWGYILSIDALIYKLRGTSLLCNRRREFWLQLPLSVAFWLIFEVYNLHLDNWTYIGLAAQWWEAALTVLIAFATIMPALFLTAELLATVKIFQGFRVPAFHPSNRLLYVLLLLGLGCLMAPLLVPREIARYLFALVWIGYVLLCEPVLYASDGDSLLRDLTQGRLHRLLSLMSAGYVCGVLWEFWNYWATAKWIYTAPFTPDVRVFEMPLAGFLGFGPFAWEFAAMYATVRLVGRDLKSNAA